MKAEFNGVVFAVVIVGWIFSLCLHEFSHALVAYIGGDRSVKDKGYLTFNPLMYTEPVTSLVLPLLFFLLGGIGLPGGAVYIETSRLRSRHWDCAVSLAGPVSNAVLLGVLAVPFWMGVVDTRDPSLFWVGYAYLCNLEVMAIVLNLLPIPPLDGFQAIGAYLRPRTRRWINAQSSLFLLALLVLMWRVDAINGAFWNIVDCISDGVGIPADLVRIGLLKTRVF